MGACHPIEIWTSGYMGIPAAEGNNFVELNAAEASMIYQNMYLSPGDVIKGSFKHRQRNNGNEQAKWVIEDQNGIEIGVVATTTVPQSSFAWRTYTGNYTSVSYTHLDVYKRQKLYIHLIDVFVMYICTQNY